MADTVLVSVHSSFICNSQNNLNIDKEVRCSKIPGANCTIRFLSLSFVSETIMTVESKG